jgi:hypothetical protein
MSLELASVQVGLATPGSVQECSGTARDHLLCDSRRSVAITDGRFLSLAVDPLEPRGNRHYRSLIFSEEMRHGYSTWAQPRRHETTRQRWMIFMLVI